MIEIISKQLFRYKTWAVRWTSQAFWLQKNIDLALEWVQSALKTNVRVTYYMNMYHNRQQKQKEHIESRKFSEYSP